MSVSKSSADWHMFSGQNWDIVECELSGNSNVFGIHLVCDLVLQNKPTPVSHKSSWNLDFPCVPEFRTYSLQVSS